MSEFKCPVVRVGPLQKHPQADTLSIAEVDGCPVIVKTGTIQEGDLAVYIPVDAVVRKGMWAPLDFLPFKSAGTHRVKAAKLRGTFSMGLLLALTPENTNFSWPPPEGTDMSPYLSITKYEEPPEGVSIGGENEVDPPFVMPVYDLEAYRKYKSHFRPEEYVAITEKVHGANGRFAFYEGQLWVGSHNRWKRRPPAGEEDRHKSNIWWKAATQADGRPVGFTKDGAKMTTLEQKLQHPDVAGKLGFYGEVYGQVQDLRYGLQGVRIAMFDILDLKSRKFLDYPEFLAVCSALGLDIVPCLFHGQLKDADAFALAEGDTDIGDGAHMLEGVVVRPLLERQVPWPEGPGRLCFKLHGQRYLLRKGGTEAH